MGSPVPVCCVVDLVSALLGNGPSLLLLLFLLISHVTIQQHVLVKPSAVSTLFALILAYVMPLVFGEIEVVKRV